MKHFFVCLLIVAFVALAAADNGDSYPVGNAQELEEVSQHKNNSQHFRTRRMASSVNSFVQRFLRLFPHKIKAGVIPPKLMLGDYPKVWNHNLISAAVKRLINFNMVTLLGGIPALGIPSLLPFKLDEPIGFNLGISRFIGVTLIMRQLKFRGLENAIVTNVNAEIFHGPTATVEYVVPKLILDVDYAFSPNTLLIPLPTLPDGHVKATFTNLKVLASVNFARVGPAGMLELKGLDSVVDVEDLNVEFAEWLTGNIVGEIFSALISVIFNFIAKLKTTVMAEKYGYEIIRILNLYFQHFHVDMINKIIMAHAV